MYGSRDSLPLGRLKKGYCDGGSVSGGKSTGLVANMPITDAGDGPEPFTIKELR